MVFNTKEVATFAGGCFWCTEAVFQRIDGVEKVVSGYTGGTIKNPTYREICTGKTGHAEAIEIHFQNGKVTFEELLSIFFATHNPTTLNQQGNDKGTQYRSAIFYHSEIQKKKAFEYIDALDKRQVFENKLVTEVTPFTVFYDAEPEHINYFNENSAQRYCQYVIVPKLEKLKKQFTDKLKSNL
ncbi:MAG: peptide-methionine (S)-S-oxide reductase [Bacteroidetes bacterium HGW-Bacteroidetes-2]|jgi:peptide-methionine (S)-S-oxide reductase|nr:MAG: peptide-methionine (S)-S-oxide reductase [Bacteroidetes bacterium HGW-Bacteroidetes-2]